MTEVWKGIGKLIEESGEMLKGLSFDYIIIDDPYMRPARSRIRSKRRLKGLLRHTHKYNPYMMRIEFNNVRFRAIDMTEISEHGLGKKIKEAIL